ncbi:MAG: hypothetical protein ACXW16_06380 [Burkholderiaceae bacterium]
MNRLKAIGCSLLLLPSLALVTGQAHAEFKCNEPGGRLDRVACEKAKESPSALRQYIQRVRIIESLQFSDYVNEAQARAWAQNDSNRTPVKKAPVQAASLPEHHGA